MHEKLICSYVYSSVYAFIASLTHTSDLIYTFERLNLSQSLLDRICLTPFWISEAIYTETHTKTFLGPDMISDLTSLSMANLLSWIAYTIYDYMHDHKIEKKHISPLLSIANICSQRSIRMCMKKAEGKPELISFLQDTYTTMDTHYTQTHVHDDEEKSFLSMCAGVYEKSIGIAIIPMITYTMCVHESDAPLDTHNLFLFFKYYLTARQLSDDLDDIDLDTALDIETPATHLTHAKYSHEYITVLMRSQIDMYMRKSIEALQMLPNFNASVFQKRFVVEC